MTQYVDIRLTADERDEIVGTLQSSTADAKAKIAADGEDHPSSIIHRYTVKVNEAILAKLLAAVPTDVAQS